MAVSGGKDSLGLLYLLWWQRRLQDLSHELFPVHVADGRSGGSLPHAVGPWVERLGLRLTIVPGPPRPEGRSLSPCFVCAWSRKRALFEAAEAMGCGVVAMGHHSDDVAVTGLMNLFYQGRFGSILPTQSYFGGRFRLVRPLYFVSEHSLARLAREEALPVTSQPCPHAARSARAVARSWLEEIVKDHRLAKRSFLGALHREAARWVGTDLGEAHSVRRPRSPKGGQS